MWGWAVQLQPTGLYTHTRNEDIMKLVIIIAGLAVLALSNGDLYAILLGSIMVMAGLAVTSKKG
jgi:hypothetical protein